MILSQQTASAAARWFRSYHQGRARNLPHTERLAEYKAAAVFAPYCLAVYAAADVSFQGVPLTEA